MNYSWFHLHFLYHTVWTVFSVYEHNNVLVVNLDCLTDIIEEENWLANYYCRVAKLLFICSFKQMLPSSAVWIALNCTKTFYLNARPVRVHVLLLYYKSILMSPEIGTKKNLQCIYYYQRISFMRLCVNFLTCNTLHCRNYFLTIFKGPFNFNFVKFQVVIYVNLFVSDWVFTYNLSIIIFNVIKMQMIVCHRWLLTFCNGSYLKGFFCNLLHY